VDPSAKFSCPHPVNPFAKDYLDVFAIAGLAAKNASAPLPRYLLARPPDSVDPGRHRLSGSGPLLACLSRLSRR
jgi:hypothetical protein